ncbi:type-F conjugative transfer system protein TraW [Gilliamella sp. BG7]|uniref:type-F conjugative transfer system protein TraW n=1 Tax=unclassified Gilliamella TaxID=2685620 RepID=UPI00398877A4
MKKFVFIFIVIYSMNVTAKDLGVFGELFPVKENNLVEVIKHRLTEMEQDGSLDAINKEMQQKAKDRLNRPVSVLTSKVDKTNERFFDPTVTLSKDLKDDKGTVFARKGTKINPLDFISFKMKLYFIDSDDALQLQWLSKQDLGLRDKIILTNGSPFEVEKKLKKKVFFDQNGQLIERLKITAVPSVVYRSGDQLLIKEISINE